MTLPRRLSVFCGSRLGVDPDCRRVAERLGRRMADLRVELVYGGGAIGLMGVLASAVLAGGGRAIGVIPRFLMRGEIAKDDLSELVVVDSMHERKTRMFALSDGCVVLPGGLGTLDEAIEMITWRQLRLHDKPIVLLNVNGYWNPLLALIDSAIAGGFAGRSARELFAVADDVDPLFAVLARGLGPAPLPSADRL